MVSLNEEQTLPDGIADQISRAWRAFKHGQASEVDLILLWMDAAARAEGTDLHPGWTISPDKLFGDVQAGLGECADELELERRGLGWLSGALEGPRRQHLIGADGGEITVVDEVDHALRGAKARTGTGPLPRRFRPAA